MSTEPPEIPPTPSTPAGGPPLTPAAFVPPIPTAAEAKGFFGALFDFSFSHFVALKVLKIVYIVYIVLIALSFLGLLIAAFAQNAGLGVLVLILGPVVAIVYLAFVRLGLEFIVAAVRTAENTSILVGRR